MAGENASSSGSSMAYEEFGENLVRMVLNRRRILESIDRLLGEKIELGPMGAGPGRKLAKVRATGWFQHTSGVEIPGDDVAYRVMLPVDVDFELEIARDINRFRAQVLIPLTITLRIERPLVVTMEITLPHEDEVSLRVATDKRRSAMLQRVTGLEAELRRFLVRVIEKELAKPHIQKATHIDLLSAIDNAWEAIAAQFLPPEVTFLPAPPPPEDPDSSGGSSLL